MNHIRFLKIVFFSLILAGCSPSIEELVEDGKLREKVLAECIKNGKKHSGKEENQVCLDAIKAQMIVIQSGAMPR